MRTEATVVGTGEHCDQAREKARAYGGPSQRIKCRAVIPAGAPFGQRTYVGQTLMKGVPITVIKHVHSAEEPPDPSRNPAKGPPRGACS